MSPLLASNDHSARERFCEMFEITSSHDNPDDEMPIPLICSEQVEAAPFDREPPRPGALKREEMAAVEATDSWCCPLRSKRSVPLVHGEGNAGGFRSRPRGASYRDGISPSRRPGIGGATSSASAPTTA